MPKVAAEVGAWRRARNSGIGRRANTLRPVFSTRVVTTEPSSGCAVCLSPRTALLLAGGTGSYLATDFSPGMIAIAE